MNIRLVLILIVLSISSIPAYSQTTFERGFKDGYKEGYCYNDYGCIAPIPPIAPIPNVNESKDNYQDGYNRGFKRGMEDKTRDLKKKQNQATPNTQQLKNHQFKDFTGADMSGTLKALPEIEMPSQSSINRKLWEQNKSSAIAIEKSYRSFNSYPSTISDGWHNVTCVSKQTNQRFSAKVLVSSNLIKDIEPGKQVAHIDMSVTYPTKINQAKTCLQLTWNYDGSIKVFDVYFFEYLSNPNSYAKPPAKKGKISFWTDKKKGVGTKIYVDGDYVGTLNGYFKKGSPYCEQGGTVTYENRAGSYQFEAYIGEFRLWSGTIVIYENECLTQGLRCSRK